MTVPGDETQLSWPWTVAIATFVLTQMLLAVYSLHRFVTLWRVWRRRRGDRPELVAAGALPRVTVQLPLYNESAVAERVIDAAASLDYPRSLLQIQVLDDSTDDTRAKVAARVRSWRERGVDIDLLARNSREGYKAGALAAGLEAATGELIAIFDADFVPAPDFLRRVVPSFNEPGVGMVQARWSHLNRDRSPLTAGQAVMLDAHFGLEHEARMTAGVFFNFNGTAGMWRRTCIIDAGGWSHDTLTEDLDLSYRAQLRGWTFRCLSAVDVPAELPADVLAFKSQQRRWAQGSIQTARKILPVLLRARLSPRVKLEGVMHLTANVAYPLLLLSGLLLAAVITAPPLLPSGLAMFLDFAAIASGVLPILLFLVAGQIARGSRGARTSGDVACALWIGAGLLVNNSLAVLGGLRNEPGDWERTPKTGDSGRTTARQVYVSRHDRSAAFEVVLALTFAALAALACSKGHVRPLPFLLLLSTGLGYVGVRSIREVLRQRGHRWVVRDAAAAVGLVLGLVTAATPAGATDPSFSTHWNDGKAEVSGYRLVVDRYGHPRSGQAALIYVTEPFSRSRHVKLEDAAAAGADAVEVLKLNLVRDFRTGIYAYHSMLSLFVESASLAPLKHAFTSTEWCGQVYEELHFRRATTEGRVFSYFDGESLAADLTVPPGGITEDELFIRLRGLRGPALPPGERRTVPFLAGTFFRRLAHQRMSWATAEIERLGRPVTIRVPAGSFPTDVYLVRPADGRSGRFHVERSHPHRIIRWEWTAPVAARKRGATERAELTGTARLRYWEAQDPGEEAGLARIGLPVPR